MSAERLLDRPLRRDGLLWVALALVVVLASPGVAANVDVGAPFDLERFSAVLLLLLACGIAGVFCLWTLATLRRFLRLRLGRRWFFTRPLSHDPLVWLAAVLVSWFLLAALLASGEVGEVLLWLLLLVLLGSGRAGLRERVRMHRSWTAWSAGVRADWQRWSAQQRHAAVVRRRRRDPVDPDLLVTPSGSWSSGSARRSDIGSHGPPDSVHEQPLGADGHASRYEQCRAVRPPDLSVRTDTRTTFAGQAVVLEWTAPGADFVMIDGSSDRLPACGSVSLVLARGRDVLLTAVNGAGRTLTRTGPIHVLPLPRVGVVDLAVPPPVVLAARVDVRLDSGQPVLQRLDAVLARQDPVLRPPSPPLGLSKGAAPAVALRAVRSGAAVLGRWRPHDSWLSGRAPGGQS